MDKTIFKQRFNYAEILPYKDFSFIGDKDEFDGESVFDTYKIKEIKKNKTKKFALLSLFSKEDYKKKNTKFFYSGESMVGFKIPIKLFFPDYRVFLTTKDRHIKRHYNRPFTSLSIHTHIRQIDLTDDKLSVRVYHSRKSRSFNSVHFIKKWDSIGFTINLKTGDFYVYKMDKKSKRVRKNSFSELKNLLKISDLTEYKRRIDSVTEFYNYQEGTFVPNTVKIFHDVRKSFHTTFSDSEFMNKLYLVFRHDLNVNVEYKNDWIYNAIISYFINKKEIKVPNDFMGLLTKWYPTKKYLKKNDNKLIASILDRLGIKSKQTIKLLHQQPKCDLSRFKIILQYFGKSDFHKYLGNLNTNILVGTFNSDKYTGVYHSFGDLKNISCITENDKEKHNILKLLNNFIDTRPDFDTQKFADDLYMKFREIDDHISMLRKIKPMFPEIDFNATTWESFHIEHMEFSKISNMISRGYSITFNYDEKLINTIEAPIHSFGKTYYPIILKKDVEYIEEGQHMHHCVGGYYEYSNSVIISVRQGSPTSDERVTCEYNSQNKKVVQERSFCNKVPPDEFITVLDHLRNRIQNYNGSIAAKEKIKTPFTKEQLLEISDIVIPNRLPF